MATRIGLTLIFALATAGCGGGRDPANAGREQVIAAFYPLAFAAQRIGGENAQIRNLTPAGVEPHDLELSGQDVKAVGDADLVLYLGRGFQPALEDAVEAARANGVDLLDVVETREGGEDEHGVDPHVWLDPVRYAAMARRIGTELNRLPGAKRFAAEVHALDREFRSGLADCERREIVTSHAAFAYLADRYSLTQVAITGLSPEAEPTPRELEHVVQEVRETGATTVFVETLISPRLAETVAREVGAKTEVLNPIEGLTRQQADAGEDYFSVMRRNLAMLRKALGCH